MMKGLYVHLLMFNKENPFFIYVLQTMSQIMYEENYMICAFQYLLSFNVA